MHGVIQIHFLVTIKHESVENNNSTVEKRVDLYLAIGV